MSMDDKAIIDDYFFYAKGRRYRIGDDYDDINWYKNLIKDLGVSDGEEVYLIHYDEGLGGCHDLGWVVISDVDELFSKIFKNGRESVTDTVGTDTSGTGIIQRFMKLLEDNGIRYKDDWIRMD